MKKKLIEISVPLFLALGFYSCKEEPPKPNNPPSNETELITTVILELTDSSTQQVKTFKFRDIDGEGGNNPSVFDTIKLEPNKIYFTNIMLLDESKNPADTISNDVKEEKNDHLFVFNSSSSQIQVTVTDKDDNNLPVGLKSKWKTFGQSNNIISVALKHQPGIKTGDANLGETDIDINFPLIIK